MGIFVIFLSIIIKERSINPLNFCLVVLSYYKGKQKVAKKRVQGD